MLGEGILKGLAETARNFCGSYVSKERLTTVEYPEERIPHRRERARLSLSRLRRRRLGGGLRCVACQICEKECPPKCIYIEKSKDKKPDYVGKPQFYPARFDIDISVCMSCQICVEVCPFEAIKMDTEFELATDDRFGGLLLRPQAAGQDRTSTTTRFIPPKRPKWTRAWPRKRPRRKPRPRLRPKPPPPKPPRPRAAAAAPPAPPATIEGGS